MKVNSLLIAILFIAFIGCKKEKLQTNNAGAGALTEEDLLGLTLLDSTITINTFPILSDSIRTDEISGTTLLGSYVDPVFGKSESSIYTHLRLEQATNFLSKPDGVDLLLSEITVDSMVLTIPVSELYGGTETQTFEVYRMTEDIDTDSEYYSNETLTVDPANLADPSGNTYKPTGSGDVIRIKLLTTLGDEIIAESGKVSLQSNDQTGGFLDWFKGIQIKVKNPSQISGEGAIFSLDMLSDASKLTMYYEDTKDNIKHEFDFVMNANCAFFSSFSHDYTGTEVQQALDNNSLGNNNFYVQAMAGINTELQLPYLGNILNEGENIVIRKAVLQLPYQADNTYDPLSSLLVLGYGDENDNVFITDQFIGNIGGVLNSEEEHYEFNITNYINKTIQDRESGRLMLAPVGASITAKRTSFFGRSSANSEKISLKIYYSTY